ncbi:MAG: Maltose/maltodextrin transport permease ue [Myxococcaceae bacterium]|nr:Maltose/maltodextrin transport permease ue [Myxococcaceae bacterium]
MPSLRRFASVLLLLVLAAVLPGGVIACGEPGEHIVLWHAHRGDEEKALTELAARYEKAHAGTTVELLAVPFDAYTAKLAAAIPHAHGPDLFIEAHERLGIYDKEGLLAPAGDAFPDADVAAFDAVTVGAITNAHGRMAVPLANKCLALYVNEELVPSGQPSGPPTPATMEELPAIQAGLPKGSYALAYDMTSSYYHAPFLHAFGGQMLSDDGRFAFHGEAATRSVEYVHDLVKRGIVPEEPSDALVASLFKSGRAATAISGPWFQSDVKDQVKYRIQPLPNLAGHPMRPFVTVEAAFLTPTGATRAPVRDLARWLGGDEAGRVRALVGHQVVSRISVWNDPEVAANVRLRAFHEAARDAIPTPTSPAMRATWVPANQAILKVLRGDASAADALAEAEARFTDIMKPAPPPPSPTSAFILIGALLLALAFFGIRRVQDTSFRQAVRASLPAYRYVAHAAIAVLALVVLPLSAGAMTSFFAGSQDAPRYVGLANYFSILTARGGPLLGHGSFWLTLLVTVVWTIFNVTLHVSIGVVLGLALSRPWLRLRTAYRILLILPWAVPSYVTALAWKGMFQRQYGAVNAILVALGAEPVSWFSHFATAFTANLATNVWLGFPFMMVVTLGALTSIPKDVLEAAEVDGATRWQRFRLVTFPLLKPMLLPSVVLGAVWTFNMFNVIFLVSGGEPDGTTDILVSEAYRWAFTRDAQYGYAAAYAVLIFFLLVFGTRLLGRLARSNDEALA